MLSLKHTDTSGPLPTSSFDLMNDDAKVGSLQLRHKLSSGVGVPKECASYIYYEIGPDYRGKGYGKEILKLGLEEARKIGLKECIVTCDSNNLASKKIIESNGGVYTKSCQCDNGSMLLRYRFEF
jgi:predicted acetyltransferase